MPSAPDRPATGDPRDHARTNALYAAEDRAARSAGLRRFRRFTEVEQFVVQTTTSSWWDETFPDAPVEVSVQRRARGAGYSAAGTTSDRVGVLWLVDGRGWSLETVLHELAHLAAGTGAGHGPRFRTTLAVLWRHHAGVQAWAVLCSELDDLG